MQKLKIVILSIMLINTTLIHNNVYADRQLSLTVYNQDFAVVKDVRYIKIDPKTKEAILTDISASIDPTSVQINAINDQTFSIAEQNFEYDLISANKLLKKMIDKSISVVLDNGKIFEGILLSVNNSAICIQDLQGRIKIINRNKQFYQIVLSELPHSLLLKPALVWKVEKSEKTKEEVEIAYQCSKISWRADYNVTVFPDNQTLRINSWVSISNKTGTTFDNTNLKLVAGEVHKVKEEIQIEAMNVRRVYAAKVMEREAPKGFEERSFAEYHLYELGRKTTIKNNQTKQIELFSASNVKYEKEYLFSGEEPYLIYYRRHRDIEEEKAIPLKVSIVFENKKKNHLGIAFPAGSVKLYQSDSKGSEHLIGIDSIEHTPKDEKIRLTIGQAFDVLGSRKVINVKRFPSTGETIVDVSIKIRNHKNIAIPVVVHDKLMGWINWTIERSNLKCKKVDYKTIEFRFKLDANSQQIINYRVRYRKSNW